ncbi:putative AlkP superfamily pyrophosphatase or phosphodiesterase [Cecembia calidifontis]|uniref:Putative AlkP superfamily pyrophosphatase or phosphodiesterase n=2 Tax=Cecembia calidifontis TaxID=1187080 RepID=A0A4Q7PIE5_9BACT|nr:putative AlkP superfamily pyrophosphatase or phosphodiesterase [Cecembia calidifontis]
MWPKESKNTFASIPLSSEMKSHQYFPLLLLIFLALTFTSKAQEKEQYVILISLDGYRYDYTERFQPENLNRFIKGGTAAEAMIPSFPSKTFPNHYTIATGMKPENHGLVDNAFYDPYKDQVYVINNREIVQDGYWYGGTPLWVLAEQQGLTTASYFFVGTEAPVKGIQPTYFYNYDGNIPNLTRISKVFEWLILPEEERPRLITLYFSDMDDIGHRYGPDNNEQLSIRLHRLDRELGALFEGLKSFDLDINVFIVSDHGMTNVPKVNLLNLNHITDGIDAKVINNGASAHLYLNNPLEIEEVYLKLNSKEGPFKTVKVREREYYKNIETYRHRMGDLLILPDLGFYLATTVGMVGYQNRSALFKTEVFGEHGYSPEYRDMHGIFYANGPRIKEGLKIPTFQNIHVYPVICEILGLKIPEGIDGELEVLKPILKN